MLSIILGICFSWTMKLVKIVTGCSNLRIVWAGVNKRGVEIKEWNFNGDKLWEPGHAVSTVGFELEKVKKYIAQQEKLEKDQEEGKF